MSEKKFFYSNGLEIVVSPYDFLLKFVRLSPDSDNETENASIDDELTVFMSPSHAKTLIPMLFMAVNEYEKNHGDIPLLPEKLEQYENFIKDVKK